MNTNPTETLEQPPLAASPTEFEERDAKITALEASASLARAGGNDQVASEMSFQANLLRYQACGIDLEKEAQEWLAYIGKISYTGLKSVVLEDIEGIKAIPQRHLRRWLQHLIEEAIAAVLAAKLQPDVVRFSCYKLTASRLADNEYSRGVEKFHRNEARKLRSEYAFAREFRGTQTIPE